MEEKVAPVYFHLQPLGYQVSGDRNGWMVKFSDTAENKLFPYLSLSEYLPFLVHFYAPAIGSIVKSCKKTRHSKVMVEDAAVRLWKTPGER